MPLSRRHFTAAAMLGLIGPRAALAQGSPLPPVLFLHGNGDHAALWMTTLWRFESNGWPRDRLHAINFTDPLSRSDDAVEQAGRSSTDDQLRELREFVKAARAAGGNARVALIGSSRGGNPIRNFVVENGGGADVSHAILCGTPNRGVFDWEKPAGSEFNGRGPFLKKLNGRDSDVVPGTAFLTLRSDGNDKFAQADGKFVGAPGVPTGITSEGPSLRGAENIALGQLDHREVSFHARAFREQFKFITGREPARLAVLAEASVALDGLVTGNPGNIPSNRAVQGASVEIYRVSAETGMRQGEALLKRMTAADGRWGPVTVTPNDALEFVITAEGYPVTHIYRSPFPRSSDVVHLRPARPLTDADKAAGSVTMLTRPRGYFGLPRDVVLLDGAEPKDVARGVAGDAVATMRLPASENGRLIIGQFNEERVAARTWPVAENRITIAELTW